jgi:hypothetical protein
MTTPDSEAKWRPITLPIVLKTMIGIALTALVLWVLESVLVKDGAESAQSLQRFPKKSSIEILSSEQ